MIEQLIIYLIFPLDKSGLVVLDLKLGIVLAAHPQVELVQVL
jgi:hypothetical protein